MSMLDSDRFRGSLLGLACGDALGTTLEFMSAQSFKPITDMVGGGPFHLRAGQWTDDTSMALCLAESLVEQRGFDAADQMQRYVRWWRDGYLSSTGKCFDIGRTTRASLRCHEETGEVFCGLTDPQSAGNGSLMRLAPAALCFAADPAQAIEMAAASSRTTHAAPAALDACRYMAGLIVGALHGATRDELLADHYAPVAGYWSEHPLAPEIAEIASGSFKHKEPPEIDGSGYVVRSLEAALWAFYKGQSFRESCLLAVNLGNDADTTGAICGQLAGAYYGAQQIPPSWLAKLAMRDKIISLSDGLHALAARA
jgi:ADP-ribosyl-[dinitrogen reductase] hydrolase